MAYIQQRQVNRKRPVPCWRAAGVCVSSACLWLHELKPWPCRTRISTALTWRPCSRPFPAVRASLMHLLDPSHRVTQRWAPAAARLRHVMAHRNNNRLTTWQAAEKSLRDAFGLIREISSKMNMPRTVEVCHQKYVILWWIATTFHPRSQPPRATSKRFTLAS